MKKNGTQTVVVWNGNSHYPIDFIKILDGRGWEPKIGEVIPSGVKCDYPLTVGTAEAKIVAILEGDEEALLKLSDAMCGVCGSDNLKKCLERLLARSISGATGIPIPPLSLIFVTGS